MIRSFYINNFKSLVEFRLPPAPHELGPFACLVGLNGAGKSTVLQALDFVGHLVSGQIRDWLRQRDWEDADLKSRFLNRTLIDFEVQLDAANVGRVVWKGAYNVNFRRCTSESVKAGGDEILRTGEDAVTVIGREPGEAIQLPRHGLQYEGSVLSILDPKRGLHESLLHLKRTVGALRSLDMLNPKEMRRRSRDAADIGYGGERLSGYLHSMSKDSKEALLHALQTFYPQLKGLTTKAMRAGWRDLRVTESYLDATKKPLDTAARQINDGLLRVLAVLSQVTATHRAHANPFLDADVGAGEMPCVLFDEIENGINPELMQRLVGLLLRANRQVIVTTHSPLILNYLPDQVAQESVVLLYRNASGHTKAVRLFDLPSTQRKLRLLGPGEVYVDTRLDNLPAEAEALGEAPAP